MTQILCKQSGRAGRTQISMTNDQLSMINRGWGWGWG